MAYTDMTALETCVRRKIEDWPIQDALTADLDASTTTIPVTFRESFALGKFFTIDQEWFRVSAVVTGTGAGNITALRGQKGSTAATHASATSTIYVDPRWGSDQIQEAITDYTGTLWPEVWAILTTSFTPDPTNTELYQLPSDFESIIACYQQTDSTITGVADVPGPVSWITVPTTVFASGKALQVTNFDNLVNDFTLEYVGRVTVTTIDSTHGHDCVCWGATDYLLGGKMAERTSPKSKAVPSLGSTTDLLRAGLNAGAKADRTKVRWRASLNHSMTRKPRIYLPV